ncbi:oligosaccharide flippase family protein [Catalinimonas sp. 4WD22]|uniref:lipopolysaccharide biosynthesis protein n=1 Tax=Catalinimonas locisalis TaxID=3133978 RepID=UPI003100D48D
MPAKTTLEKAWKKVNSKSGRQIFSLLGSNVLVIVLGVVVSIINTRLLGPEAYGDYKFIQSLWGFILILLTGGAFNTAGRLVALNEYQGRKKELLGGIFTVSGATCFLFMIVVLVASYIQENIYDNGLGETIRLLLPVVFFFPFKEILERILEGDNRIYDLSAYRLSQKILYIIPTFLIGYFSTLTLELSLLIHLLAIAIFLPYVYISMKPKFKNLKKSFMVIKEENAKHGFPIYIGSLASNGSQHLSAFTISYFLDNVSVGYFALSNTIATPLMMIPQTIGTTSFKKFANSKSIPVKTVLATIAVSIIALVAFNIIVKYVILFVYSDEYLPVLPYVRLVSLSYVIQGFCFFINRFLSSHGRGKELRNASFVRGGINILGFIVLVKYFGIDGACITLIISNAVYLTTLYFQYKRYIRS